MHGVHVKQKPVWNGKMFRSLGILLQTGFTVVLQKLDDHHYPLDHIPIHSNLSQITASNFPSRSNLSIIPTIRLYWKIHLIIHNIPTNTTTRTNQEHFLKNWHFNTIQCQSFGETYYLHLQPWRWKQHVSPKRWYLPMSPHGITTQKNNVVIFTTVRTLNLIHKVRIKVCNNKNIYLCL
jgi:hypothetical protein